MIPAELLREINAQAEREYPNECCGLILSGPDGRMKVKPCRNLQDEYHRRDPENFTRSARSAYFIDPNELLAIHKEARATGMAVRYIYHSHIDAEAYFSEEDKRMALSGEEPAYPGVDYLVVSVLKGKEAGANLFYWDNRSRDFLKR